MANLRPANPRCAHTKCPTDYLAWSDWAARKMRHFECTKCPTCGLWMVWKRRTGVPREIGILRWLAADPSYHHIGPWPEGTDALLADMAARGLIESRPPPRTVPKGRRGALPRYWRATKAGCAVADASYEPLIPPPDTVIAE